MLTNRVWLAHQFKRRPFHEVDPFVLLLKKTPDIRLAEWGE